MTANERMSLTNHGLTLAASVSASCGLATAVAQNAANLRETIIALVVVVSTMILTAAILRRLGRGSSPPPIMTPALLLLGVVPYLVDGVQRLTIFGGMPLEIVILISIQLMANGMAAASCWQSCQPLTMVASLFVMLFSASICPHRSTLVSAGLFAVFGVIWLLSSHWTSLGDRLLPLNVPKKVRFSPVLSILIAGIIALSFQMSDEDRLWALAGVLPSSGGDGRLDLSANRGIGNGQDLVAGEDNIQSFGPIEEAPFRASESPSLYDLFNDMYEEPVRNQKQERSIPLPPDLTQQLESRLAKSEQAGREFSTARKQRTRSNGEMSHLSSESLFYVKGRVPLHLRQAVYDLFDGRTWHTEEAPVDPHPPRFTESDGRPWLCLTAEPSIVEYGPLENHALKIVHLNTNRIPTPLHIDCIHIDRVDRPDFFQLVGNRFVQMDRASLPELTSIHLRSRTIHAESLREEIRWNRSRQSQYTLQPEGPEFDRIRDLALEWSANRSRGWPQIQAILDRLKSDYQLDPHTKPPENIDYPCAHFLFESRRGPDYLFATSAALLLRSLGYSTRLASGFYVSPERFDRKSGHTAVVGADAHTWLEVYYNAGLWLTAEPSPGYYLLEPPPTFWQQIVYLWRIFVLRITQSWPLWNPLLAGLTILWYFRARCLESLAITLWKWLPANSPRTRMRQTVRLIHFRLWVAGIQRSAGETWPTTFRRISATAPSLQQELATIADSFNWATFSPDGEPIPSRIETRWKNACELFARTPYTKERSMSVTSGFQGMQRDC